MKKIMENIIKINDNMQDKETLIVGESQLSMPFKPILLIICISFFCTKFEHVQATSKYIFSYFCNIL